MKSNRVARIFTTRQFRAPAALLLVALLQGHVLSQRAGTRQRRDEPEDEPAHEQGDAGLQA